MAKIITFSIPQRFVGFAGITASPNEVRQMTVELRKATNLVFKPRSKRGRPLEYIGHDAASPEDRYTTKGEDDYGTFLTWKFPVFVTNKNEMYITVKVWTDEVHGGSCIMWALPAYKFTDG